MNQPWAVNRMVIGSEDGLEYFWNIFIAFFRFADIT